MKSRMLSVILLLSLIGFQSAAQHTLILQPDAAKGKDALLHGLNYLIATNYGTCPELAANAWTFQGVPGTVRGVVEFNLSEVPAGSTITSAELSLYAWDSVTGFGQHSTRSGSNECFLQRITGEWDEMTVAWYNQPATTTENQVWIPASVSPDQDYTAIDVTALVTDMVNNPSSSHGFMLRLCDESFYRLLNFASSDHPNSQLHPKLQITYTEPIVQDSCITLQPGPENGKDTFVHGLYYLTTTNYGDNPQFAAVAWTFDGIPGTVRGLIDFERPQIRQGLTLKSATLTLFAWDSSTCFGQHSGLTGSNACWLQRVTSAWDEHTVTWDTQPETTTEHQTEIPSTDSLVPFNTTVDVTGLVLDILKNTGTSFGFMLRLQDENYYRRMNYASSDHPNKDMHPKLELCFIADTINPELKTVPETNGQISFTFGPNPAGNYVNVGILTNPETGSTIEIINMQGKIVKRIVSANTSETINLSDCPRGMYFIQIIQKKASIARKIFIE